MYDYDLFVIGAGSGGVRAARRSAELGGRVAVCEDRPLGGTCVNVGCVPKKILMYGSSYRHHFEDAAGFGWSAPPPAFAWRTLVDRKDREIERLNHVYRRLLTNAGVTIVDGRGHLVDPHTVEVAGQRYTAKHVLVATGGRPVVPEIPGREHVVTSEAMFTLPELPRRAVVVGSGYIGTEFACILRGFGVEVTLVSRGGEILRGFDDDLRAVLDEQLEAQGIEVMLDTEVARIELDGATRRVHLFDGSVLAADLVLYATGRAPNTAGLGLEAAGVAVDDKGAVVVDDAYRTSAPHIYAVGDVTNRKQLTPVALAEGERVARALFGQGLPPLDYDLVPTAVFTQPPLATVGWTEHEARQRRAVVRVYTSSFRPLKHTISGRDEKSFLKLVVCGETDVVLGCHMVGEDAPEIIQGLAVAMTAGATKAQFDATIGIHPTAAEEFVTMRTPRA